MTTPYQPGASPQQKPAAQNPAAQKPAARNPAAQNPAEKKLPQPSYAAALDAARAQAHAKSSVLIEALPWIQRFRDSIVVVKYGGNAMIDDQLRRAFAADMVFMRMVGINVVVVHGGGPHITRMLDRLGKTTDFRAGMRVTDAETARIARMVLVGEVGRDLVGLINQHGPYAIGMSGEDAQLFSATRTRPVVDGEEIDLGQVGAITQVRPESLQALLDAGRIPVVSSIAPEIGADGTPTGDILNINADLAAAAIAEGLGAEKLVMLTDVEGLYRNWPDPETLIPEISASDLRDMLPTLTAGMIPKARALLDAVDAGIRTAAIIDGRIEHAVLLEVFTTKGVGTMVRRDDYA